MGINCCKKEMSALSDKNKTKKYMTTAIILIFIIGYLAITLEHFIKIDKAASVLFIGVLCWTIYILTSPINII